MNSGKPVPVAKSHRSRNAMMSPINQSNRDPAAIAAAFERADTIVALEGFVPDDNYRAIQRRVIAGELTSVQAVQLVVAQAQAADRALAAAAAKAA
jgi:outer membrane protein assembly factor BamD (BamD/ComL family)